MKIVGRTGVSCQYTRNKIKFVLKPQGLVRRACIKATGFPRKWIRYTECENIQDSHSSYKNRHGSQTKSK